MRSLDRLLNPSTIAVIGGGPAVRAIEQSDRLGFEGEIWAVHPNRNEMAGRAVYRSVAELPGVPDAAFVAVNRNLSIEAVRDLARLGCGGAVLHASGYAEAGPEGAALQSQLTDGHDMPLIGPNCYGTINALSGAAMWPDVHGCRRVERGSAFVSQSGNIALNMTMNKRGVDFAYTLSLGNEASVTLEETILHLAADPRVTTIGMYVESITDSVAFGEAALAAKEHQTPLVALKTGRTEAAGTIAVTHTAAISAPSDAYDALFSRYGVKQAASLPELLTTISLLDAIGPLPGNRLISLSCSGGEASVVADRAAQHDVRFEPLTPDHASRIKATLSDLVAMTNPLDYHTFIWGDGEALERCFTEVLDGPVDAGMLVLDWPDDTNDDADWWPTLRAIESASAATGTKAIVVTSLPENLPDRVREYLADQGLGCAGTIEEALAGLEACAAVGAWLSRPTPDIHLAPRTVPKETVIVGEVEAKARLSRWGIHVPTGIVVRDGDDVDQALSFPVVAKTIGEAHKTEKGGVETWLANHDDLTEARSRLHRHSDELLIEEMITGGTELLVSVRNVPSIGMVATFGAGGTLAELFDDTATVLLPTTPDEISKALRGTKIGAVLGGVRGGPPADMAAISDVVGRLADYLIDSPHAVEVEINPLIATPTRAVAADALMVEEAR